MTPELSRGLAGSIDIGIALAIAGERSALAAERAFFSRLGRRHRIGRRLLAKALPDAQLMMGERVVKAAFHLVVVKI
ncbi:MAG: hypothetical protein R2762_06625 [Bryobacteraceae bacterium]